MKDLRERIRQLERDFLGTSIPITELLEAFARSVRDEALEKAAQICSAHATGYRNLQHRAREDKDTTGALAHLCEKQSAEMCAKDIRALKTDADADAEKILEEK